MTYQMNKHGRLWAVDIRSGGLRRGETVAGLNDADAEKVRLTMRKGGWHEVHSSNK